MKNGKYFILSLLLLLIISFMMITLLFLSQDFMKHGVILNFTNNLIKGETLLIKLDGDSEYRQVEDIEKNKSVLFSKIRGFSPRIIKSIIFGKDTINKFDQPVYLKNNITLHFLTTPKEKEVFGLCISSGFRKFTQYVCVNFSNWILPIYGFNHRLNGYIPYFSFPVNKDIKIFNIEDPQDIDKIFFINLFNLVEEKPLDVPGEGPKGPNAVVGVEIGILEYFLGIITSIIYLSSVLLGLLVVLFLIIKR